MARLPNVTREQLEPEDRHYFDEITGNRGGVLRNPFGILLHSPELAAQIAATSLTIYRGYEGDMSKALREVVILATARETRSQYEFTSHAPIAREAGVSDKTIRAIAQGTAPQGLSGDEELVVRYTQELLRDHKISDSTFDAIEDRFGVRGTVDLTALIGSFLLIGQFLIAFGVELAPGVTPELPL